MKSTKKTSIILEFDQQEAEMLKHLVETGLLPTGLHSEVRKFLETLQTALSTVTR